MHFVGVFVGVLCLLVFVDVCLWVVVGGFSGCLCVCLGFVGGSRVLGIAVIVGDVCVVGGYGCALCVCGRSGGVGNCVCLWRF